MMAVSDKICIETRNAYFVLIIFFPPQILAGYFVMFKSMVQAVGHRWKYDKEQKRRDLLYRITKERIQTHARNI